MDTRIEQVLKSKGNAVYDVDSTAPVVDAVNKMSELGIGSVLVRKDDNLVGIVTERDLARRCVVPSVNIDTTSVDKVMTSPVAYVSPETTVVQAMKAMSETHCRHLPVLVDGKVIGIISLGDLLRWTTGELETQVNYLESYIRGY